MKSSILWIGALTVLVAGAFPMAAQEEPGPQVFGEAIDVRVVNVETVVTDEKGELARGLKAEDFRLLVDGKEVPVEYFSEIVEGAAAAAGGPRGRSPPRSGRGKRWGGATGLDRRLLFHREHPRRAADPHRARPGGPETERRDGGPRLRRRGDRRALPLEPDRAVVATALSGAKKRPAHGHQFLAQHRSKEGDNETAIEGAINAGLEGNEIAELVATLNSRVSPEVRGRLGKTAQAAAAALRGFEAPPGRKVLMFLTAGWAMSEAPHLYGPMIDAANRVGYTVYPVDAASSDAQGMKVLDVIATQTGGKVASTAKMDVMRQVAADTSSYYWLGASPPRGRRTSRATRWRSRSGAPDSRPGRGPASRTSRGRPRQR